METANYPPFSVCAVFSIALKLLLIPAYKSTDFEVHRNWLAITNSLPLSRWYFEDISEWTLDYPPFFAAFEWCLSQIARFVDPGMLQLRNLGYDSSGTVYFQRISVIVTELFLLLVLIRIASTVPQSASAANHATALSIYLSPGLLIIDHIHFQYNGFLFGLLILSIYFARESRYVSCGLAFASLLCFKHIFLYIAPAYFIFLLRAYCLRTSYPWINVENTIKLGVSVVSVFAIAFGPFVYLGQIPQLLSRLFPFSRGLCHAYWAPNIWAIYSFVDRILIGVAPHFKYRVDKSALNSVTRGLVGDSSFAVLPNITPRMTFLLTLGVQTISLAKLFVQPTYDKFVGSITLCGFASFLFGWHVHEKAILLVIIPFSLLVLKDRRYLGAFRPLAVAGHVSLFPLLFTVAEFPIKTVYTLLWLIVFLSSFDNLAPVSRRIFLLDRFSVVYVIVSVPLIVYTSLFHGIIFGQKYEFLPLMFTSSYSAIGVVGSFVGFLVLYFID